MCGLASTLLSPELSIMKDVARSHFIWSYWSQLTICLSKSDLSKTMTKPGFNNIRSKLLPLNRSSTTQLTILTQLSTTEAGVGWTPPLGWPWSTKCTSTLPRRTATGNTCTKEQLSTCLHKFLKVLSCTSNCSKHKHFKQTYNIQ